MGNSNLTWRTYPFIENNVYMALINFSGFPKSNFCSGEKYIFVSGQYSRYDSSTVFTFKVAHTKEPIYWWWHDDEPENLCAEYFELVK